VTLAISKMIATDLLPYAFVEGQGFKNLMATVCANYDVPSRTSFSRHHIPELYKAVADKVKNIMHADIGEGKFSIYERMMIKLYLNIIFSTLDNFEIDAIIRFSFTTDGWTSINGMPYLSLTVHYIDRDFNLKHFTLAIKDFDESHTARNIANKLQAILREWDLVEQKICFTTDNARNIVAAVNLVPQWDRIPCFIHTLQLGMLYLCY